MRLVSAPCWQLIELRNNLREFIELTKDLLGMSEAASAPAPAPADPIAAGHCCSTCSLSVAHMVLIHFLRSAVAKAAQQASAAAAAASKPSSGGAVAGHAVGDYVSVMYPNTGKLHGRSRTVMYPNTGKLHGRNRAIIFPRTQVCCAEMCAVESVPQRRRAVQTK